MTDFELIILGFFIGIFFSMIMIMVGVLYDKGINKREYCDDSDVRIYFPNRCRNRCGNNRRN